MKRNQSSVTAHGIAAMRAVESNKPPEQRICYDPLARKLVNPAYYFLVKLFAGYGDLKAPGTIGFLVARTRYIDDYLQSCIDGGIEQLVILGAGLDSRAYRFERLAGNIGVFEVDHPTTQQEKCKKLRKVFGRLPTHVAYVPIDFNVDSLEKLDDFGYERQRKTLFIWEGVTYYLEADAAGRTLEFVRKNSGNGSTIIFDYIISTALTADQKRGEIIRMQRYRRFTGEGLIWGVEEGKIDELLGKHGYTQIVNATSEDLKKAYFTGDNRNRPIAPIYAIVHAAFEGMGK